MDTPPAQSMVAQMGTTPSVSVIVTTYNQELYIAAAIESVLAQTYSDYEIVVVDDGSSDRTFQRASTFSRRVTLIRQDNRGPAGSRNAGIERARGELLAFLDGDDLWEPGKLARQVAAARAHATAGLIAVDGVQFGGGVLRQSLFAPSITSQLSGRDSVTRRCFEEFLRANLIATTSQVMVPRSVLDVVGVSDTTFRIASDWDLYLRIAKRYDVTFLSERLTRWRYLPTSASGPSTLRQLRWAPDEIRILKKHLRAERLGCRGLVRSALSAKIRATADAAYDFGVRVDRGVAGRYLLELLRGNLTSYAVICSVIALYVPRRVTRVFGKRLRKIMGLVRRAS
jgi:glycosyltransferase involved in cell wall biosynthesis